VSEETGSEMRPFSSEAFLAVFDPPTDVD